MSGAPQLEERRRKRYAGLRAKLTRTSPQRVTRCAVAYPGYAAADQERHDHGSGASSAEATIQGGHGEGVQGLEHVPGRWNRSSPPPAPAARRSLVRRRVAGM